MKTILRTVAVTALMIGIFAVVAYPSAPATTNYVSPVIMLADGSSPPPTCNPFTQPNCKPPQYVEVADGSSPPPTCNPFTQPNCKPPQYVEVADGSSPPPTCNPFTQPNCKPPAL